MSVTQTKRKRDGILAIYFVGLIVLTAWHKPNDLKTSHQSGLLKLLLPHTVPHKGPCLPDVDCSGLPQDIKCSEREQEKWMEGERVRGREDRREREREMETDRQTERQTDRDRQKDRDMYLPRESEMPVISHPLQFRLILAYTFEVRFMSKKQSKNSKMAFDCCHRFMESNGLFSLLTSVVINLVETTESLAHG